MKAMKVSYLWNILVSCTIAVCDGSTTPTTTRVAVNTPDDGSPSPTDTRENTFLLNCDMIRRMKQLSQEEIELLCGKSNSDSQTDTKSDISWTQSAKQNVDSNSDQVGWHRDSATDSGQNIGWPSSDSDQLPVKEWPVFKHWDSMETTPETAKKGWTVDWSWLKSYTVPPIEIPDPPTAAPSWRSDWNGNIDTKSKSTFGITGVVIGLGALVVLAVVMSLGIVYCCRNSYHRRLRRQRLFLITARADEDYEQFRHDMETTPPCVGLHVECPPSYEDALHHSATPPEIVVDNFQTQSGLPSPPSYNAVIEATSTPNNEVTSSTSHTDISVTLPESATRVNTLAEDLEGLLNAEEVGNDCLSSKSQLVLKQDKESQ